MTIAGEPRDQVRRRANFACEYCGETSLVTFWRFEGLSGQPGCSNAGRHESLANSQH